MLDWPEYCEVCSKLGFIEGVLMGIEMTPKEFRVEAVAEAREALDEVLIRLAHSPNTSAPARADRPADVVY